MSDRDLEAKRTKAERQREAELARRQRTIHQVYSLSNALIRSEVVLRYFMREMREIHRSGKSDPDLADAAAEGIHRLEATPALRVGSLSALYLATLYAVIEKWQHWKFSDPVVDPLLASPYLHQLKKYRHAVFHADSFDARDLRAPAQDPEMIGWAKNVTVALHAALLDWFTNPESRLAAHFAPKSLSA